MKYTIGIDIGGTKINTILYDGKKIKRQVILKTSKNKKSFLNQIVDSIQIVASGFSKRDIKGIGIGVPGILDGKKEKIISLPNLKGMENFPLKNFIKRRHNLKIVLENDVNCMTLAESKIGQGRGVQNMVCLALGTGIGGGIMINKKIYTGRGNAPEPGHITINENGLKCSCGNYGCLEEYFSGRAISMEAKKAGLPTHPLQVETLAKKGNKKAREIYKKLGKHLGIGLSNIIKILDPEIVILGGGVSNAYNLFMPSTLAEVKKRMHFAPCRIVKSKLNSAGAIGAALLIS